MCLFEPIIRGDDDSSTLYELLDVRRGATAEQIRAAYRRASLRQHPDKLAQRDGGRPATPRDAARFARLQEAYKVLADPATRRVYDGYGEHAVGWVENPAR